MILLANLVGLTLIALIAWWFWWPRRRPETVAGDDAVEIVVADGIYRPERIVLDAGKPARLRFVRRDPSACAEQVVFTELGIGSDLKLGAATEVALPALEPGEYGFTCQMGMYRGQVVVR